MISELLKSPCGRIGVVLRTFREKTGRSLSTVSYGAGISISMLSQIERGIVSPSIDTLFKVCRELELDIADLFNRLSQRGPVKIQHPRQRLTTREEGARYEQLVASIDSSHPAEMFLLHLDPSRRIGLSGHGHEGAEMGFVLEGSACLTVDGIEYRIQKDDSVSFVSHLQHSLVNDGTQVFVAVWVVFPPHKDYLEPEAEDSVQRLDRLNGSEPINQSDGTA